MKQLNIEKELRVEANKYTPNSLDKIKLAAQSQNLLPPQDSNRTDYISSGAKVKSKIKGKTIGIISSCSAFIMAIILILVFLINGAGNVIPPMHVALSSNNAYGFGAVSTVKLLGSNLSTASLTKFSFATERLRSNNTNNPPKEIDSELWEQLNKFNDYFSAFDNFLGEGILETETVANSDKTYEYATKMTIKAFNFDGEPVVYYMYYTENEILSYSAQSDNLNVKYNSKGLVHYDGNDDDEHNNGSGNGNGVTYKRFYDLDGVMLIDGNTYHIEGDRCFENEDDESESELTLTAYANVNDKSSYIRMEQEITIENGETETDYIYSVYSGNKLIEKTVIDFETQVKHGKKETEFGIDFITDGKIKGSYGIKREVKNGKTEMKVSYSLNGKKGSFTICEKKGTNGEKCFEYSLSNNCKFDLKAH